jgi:hypothetical protein
METYQKMCKKLVEMSCFLATRKLFAKNASLDYLKHIACCNMKYLTPAGNDGIRQFSRGSELFCAPKRTIYANERS